MDYFWKTMLKGLLAVLPVLITLYVVYWIAATMEFIVGGFLRFIFLQRIYVPGMGLLFGVALLYFAGVMMERGGAIRKISSFVERQFEKIPFIKSLYGGTRDMMRFFSPDKEGGEMKKVVLVNLDNGARLIGFVTGKIADRISASLPDETNVAVYLPMSYQIGGYTIYVPHANIQPLDMSVEEAMKIVLTGGMVKSS